MTARQASNPELIKQGIVFVLIVSGVEVAILYLFEGLALLIWCFSAFAAAWLLALLVRKPNQRTRENILILLAYAYVTALGIGYLAYTEDSNIVVDVDGSPKGLAPNLRSLIKPKQFYSSQKTLIEQEWNRIQVNHVSGSDKVRSSRVQIEQLTDQILSSPEIQRAMNASKSMQSKAESAAQQLERQADVIRKQAEDVRLAEYYDQEYQAKLQTLRQKYRAVEQRLLNSSY